jgi:hypothetical protein
MLYECWDISIAMDMGERCNGREATPCEMRLFLVSESACFLGIWDMLSFLGSQKERRLCCKCFA